MSFQLDREKRSLDEENTVTKTKKPRRSLVDVFLDDLVGDVNIQYMHILVRAYFELLAALKSSISDINQVNCSEKG